MRVALLAAFTVLGLAPLSPSAAPVPKAPPEMPRVLAAASNKGGNWDIHLVQPGTGETGQLTDDKASDTEPVWSPDGKRIAFVSDRGGQPDLWVMNADGSDQKTVTKKHGGCTHPRWSPDGKRVAFVNAGKDGRGLSVIDIAEIATGDVTRLADGYRPEWSPDGKWIVHSALKPRGGSSLHVIRADKSDTRTLDAGWSAVWSPDGGRLAYIDFTGQPRAGRVYVADGDGANPKEIGLGVSDVRWSPDGRRLCFTDVVKGNLAVVVTNADGTGREPIAADVSLGARWSPDGKVLSYLRRPAKGRPVMLVVSDPDGGNAKELLAGVEAAAEWKPK